jgi:hypothetical protein
LRTIIVNNATATIPFGAIDTPRQGEIEVRPPDAAQ